MADSKTPGYDQLHPVVQDRIDSLIEIKQRIKKGVYTPSPADNKLKEYYAAIPKEDLYEMLKKERSRLTGKMLAAHRDSYAR